jgi:hypothetical protein
LVDAKAIRQWLELLYRSLPGYVSVVTLPGASSRFFATDELDDAAAYAAVRSLETNVYVGCCTLAHVPTAGRGGAANTTAIPGVWCDLDVAGGLHRRPVGDDALLLPATVDDAFSLLDAVGLPSTAVLHSGGGLQAWWLFQEPLLFATDRDRVEAAGLSSAFGVTLVELARCRGWHVDDVSDLARILRPPGSVNRKREPVCVRLLSCSPECRYTPAQIESVLVAPVPPPVAHRRIQPALCGNQGEESPAEALCRIASWADIIGPAGFKLMYEDDGVGYWHHRASTTGPMSVSATTDAHGSPVLVVFSESAAAATGLPAGAGHRLTKFRAWSLIHFRGDEAAAARALRQLGRRGA